MNAGEHPTVDQIADLDAGLLQAAEAAEVSGHLAECGECQEVLVQLHDVTDLLAAEGRQPLPIPVEVATSLDAALERARIEQEAGVPSLVERRATSVDAGTAPGEEATPVTGRTHRRARMLLGAAAAVVVLGVGAAVASNLVSGGEVGQDSSTAGAAQSGGQAQGSASDKQQPGAAAGPTSERAAEPTPTLDRSNVDAYARQLADGTVHPVPAAPVCGTSHAFDTASRADQPSSLVEYDGKQALLTVDTQRHRLIVFSCPGPGRVLYTSAY